MRSIIISLTLLLLFSCNKKSNDISDDIFYPYTEHSIEYMGFQEGLSNTSSDDEFSDALDEIQEQFFASQTTTTNRFTFNGITYNLTNLDEEKPFPRKVWDTFWEDLDEYDYSIGSCWAFSYIHIPSKEKAGTIYFIYAIASEDRWGEVIYNSTQGTLIPGKTRSTIKIQNPINIKADNNHYSTSKRANTKKE